VRGQALPVFIYPDKNPYEALSLYFSYVKKVKGIAGSRRKLDQAFMTIKYPCTIKRTKCLCINRTQHQQWRDSTVSAIDATTDVEN
jgi:hypothetical protein